MYLHPGDIETAYAAYLESIQCGLGIADGCDQEVLRSRQWAKPDNTGRHLTEQGRHRLQQWGGNIHSSR
jgi:hypothetical protein